MNYEVFSPEAIKRDREEEGGWSTYSSWGVSGVFSVRLFIATSVSMCPSHSPLASLMTVSSIHYRAFPRVVFWATG